MNPAKRTINAVRVSTCFSLSGVAGSKNNIMDSVIYGLITPLVEGVIS